MIFHEPQVEIRINDKFVPVSGIESVKEGDVFRTVGKDGEPTVSQNLWIDGKYYTSIRSWRAIGDAMIDAAGRYNVEAVPEDGSLGIIKHGNTMLVAPTKKSVLLGLGVLVSDLIGLGLVAPALISAPSTIAVIAGFGVVGVCVILTGAYFLSFLQKENNT